MLTIWWCPCVESSLVLLEEVFAMTSEFSWENSISLCPASFCIPRPNFPVTPYMSWLPTFAFQSPIMKRTSFLGVSSKDLVRLHRTVQLQLLQHYWLGHRIELLWYWSRDRTSCKYSPLKITANLLCLKIFSKHSVMWIKTKCLFFTRWKKMQIKTSIYSRMTWNLVYYIFIWCCWYCELLSVL